MAENIAILLRGFIIGVSIAAPVGPIGVLCIRRTLVDGALTGFLSGLGAATADMIYGAIAAFGLTVIMDMLVGQANWLKLMGGIFLVYLGARTFLTKPADEPARSTSSGLLDAYLSTLFLTITNPMTIIAFIAIFAGAMPHDTGNSPLGLVVGVFTGSAFWWLALSFGISMMRGRIGPNMMLWINRLSGLVIMTFGAISLLSLK